MNKKHEKPQIRRWGLFVMGLAVVGVISLFMWMLNMRGAAILFAASALSITQEAATGIPDREISLRAFVMAAIWFGPALFVAWIVDPEFVGEVLHFIGAVLGWVVRVVARVIEVAR
jgi:hypothetical protein